MTLHTTTRDIAYQPDAAAQFHALADPQHSLLLESADIESKDNVRCMAILRAAVKVTCHGQEVTVTPLTPVGEHIASKLTDLSFARPDASDERERLLAPSPVDVLRRLQFDDSYGDDVLPFIAGGFAFDFVDTFEDLPKVVGGPNDFPDYEFFVGEEVLSINHETKTATIHAVTLDGVTPSTAVTVTNHGQRGATENNVTISAQASISDAEFRTHVEQLKEHIHAGDIFQVVPSRAFTLECPDAYAAYRRLRETNPSPYMFYVRGADYELFGASPESSLKFDAATRTIELYPIAGTRPRGETHELDIRNELELRTDAKELSEHIMLVDLARNDLARVAVPGTREVADLLAVDRYSRVMHLVSRVTATLDADIDALDAYRACMNMGTLTGAPKLRATELIRGIEKQRRGSYGGAVGYLAGDGSMDTCIVIRSAYVKDGVAVVQAGAGVVRDSDPQAEADETLHKAAAVLHAIAGENLEVIR